MKHFIRYNRRARVKRIGYIELNKETPYCLIMKLAMDGNRIPLIKSIHKRILDILSEELLVIHDADRIKTKGVSRHNYQKLIYKGSEENERDTTNNKGTA